MHILVSDFDGTLTNHDFFELVQARWPPESGDDPWKQYLAGELTHFEALARIFARIQATETELRQLVRSMEIAPGLAKSIDALRAAGWDVVIASAGCEWYIRQLLEQAGVTVELHANPGFFDPARGLVMRLPEGSPFLNLSTGVDKVKVVEDAIRRADRAAFAGDGPPDLAPALLVDPLRRFARRWLAEALRERAEPFQNFSEWREIADNLTGC